MDEILKTFQVLGIPFYSQDEWLTPTVNACYHCLKKLESPGADSLKKHYRSEHTNGNDMSELELTHMISIHWLARRILAEKSQPNSNQMTPPGWPNELQQVLNYAKSRCAPIQSLSMADQESAVLLLRKLLSSGPPRLDGFDLAFGRIGARFLLDDGDDIFEFSKRQFFRLLDGQIGRDKERWLKVGCYMGITITCSLICSNNCSNALWSAIFPEPSDDVDVAGEASSPEENPPKAFCLALDFAVRTLEEVIKRLIEWKDANTLPFLYTQMVFLRYLSELPSAVKRVEKRYPWEMIAKMLNHLSNSYQCDSRVDSKESPGHRPLPEDYDLENLPYGTGHLHIDWSSGKGAGQGKTNKAWMESARAKRIVEMGRDIADLQKWLVWDNGFAALEKARDKSVETPRVKAEKTSGII